MRSREQRLSALRDDGGSSMVPGALFEARLRTLLLPERLLESDGGAPSPLRALVASAAGGASVSAAVRRSWWVERAGAVCGVCGTDAQLLFDLAVCWGADLGSALKPPSAAAQRGAFLSLADADPSVVRAAFFCDRSRAAALIPPLLAPATKRIESESSCSRAVWRGWTAGSARPRARRVHARAS
jgi:hypothetical protein